MVVFLIVNKVLNEKKFNNFEVLINIIGKGFVGLFVLFLFVLIRNILIIECMSVCIFIFGDLGELKKISFRIFIFFIWNLFWFLEYFFRYRILI